MPSLAVVTLKASTQRKGSRDEVRSRAHAQGHKGTFLIDDLRSSYIGCCLNLSHHVCACADPHEPRLCNMLELAPRIYFMPLRERTLQHPSALTICIAQMLTLMSGPLFKTTLIIFNLFNATVAGRDPNPHLSNDEKLKYKIDESIFDRFWSFTGWLSTYRTVSAHLLHRLRCSSSCWRS